jgi:hypothetical protein
MGQLGRIWRWLREKATVIILVAFVAGSLWALMAIPPREVGWIKKVDDFKREEREDEARRTIIQVVGGAFAIFALFLTLRRVVVAEQGHITDRYTKAVEQIGKVEGDKPNIEVRLGGIYALERIALDSPRDHWIIMEVLTAYVRRNAPSPTQTGDEQRSETDIKPETDIQAILTALGRRRWRRETDNQCLDLSKTDLRGANLSEARLDRSILGGAYLTRARLTGTHLRRANLFMAHMEGAFLNDARMEGAFLMGAHMEGADLSGAHLNRADLMEAHLEGALGLSPGQIRSAINWEHAHYSTEFRNELGLPNAVTGTGEGTDDAGQARSQ